MINGKQWCYAKKNIKYENAVGSLAFLAFLAFLAQNSMSFAIKP
jgi:hypothetical protein